MNIFAIIAGIQIGLYLLLAYVALHWKRKLAALAFVLMAGRAVSDVLLFLQFRTFPAGVLGRYDAALFPLLIVLAWVGEISFARYLRRWFINGSRNH